MDQVQGEFCALKEKLIASNIFVRTVIVGEVGEKPDVCRRYQIQTSEQIMTVTCDDKRTVDIGLDGNPTIYPKRDKECFEVITEVSGTKIIQDFQGAVYESSEGQMFVTKIISCEYFGTSFKVEVSYRKEYYSLRGDRSSFGGWSLAMALGKYRLEYQ
jgi:hypothetical protein